MKGILSTSIGALTIKWETSCSLVPKIQAHTSIAGTANNIQGEVFFYQPMLDLPFNGQEKEVFEKGDIVYWKSATDPTKFAILLMYGNTVVGDGTKIRTPSPGIKIGEIKEKNKIELILIQRNKSLFIVYDLHFRNFAELVLREAEVLKVKLSEP